MYDAYILCATPRTGSTLLCGLLAKAGAGDPDSYYGRAFMDDWARQWGLPGREAMTEAAYAAAYLDAAVRAGKGGTPVFGLRLMRENVGDLSAALDLLHPGLASDAARFERAFGRILYVHLSRSNKLAQAVSYIKAQQTGLWHVAPDGSEIERLAEPQDPRYDFARIKAEVDKIEAYDAAWAEWFAIHSIVPHRIGYEDLSRAPAAALHGLWAALGMPSPGPAAVVPGVAKLSDRTNDDWIRQYLLDSSE